MFTVPQSGVWRVSFSLTSGVGSADTENQSNLVCIVHNEDAVVESQDYTGSEWYHDTTTGGRELITRAEQGDTLYLQTNFVQGSFQYIMICFEFVSP